MELGYTPEQEALPRRTAGLLRRAARRPRPSRSSPRATASARPPSGVWKQMGADGWLGIGWPKEWGGQGRTAIEQFIFFDESMRAGAPVPMLTHQHRRPDDHALRHRRAEASSSCRRSSPARSTSASATPSPAPAPTSPRCRPAPCATATSTSSTARRCGRASPSDADYCWLAVRTDPEAPKHKGISIFIVPMDTPGITIQPLQLMGEHDINPTFFDDVRVPRQEPGRRGERRLAADHQPAQPRARHALLRRHRRAQPRPRCATGRRTTTLPDGRRVIDQEWVQINLARVHARLEFLRLINWKVAWTADAGRLRRRRRVDHEGVRHRVLPRGVSGC